MEHRVRRSMAHIFKIGAKGPTIWGIHQRNGNRLKRQHMVRLCWGYCQTSKWTYEYPLWVRMETSATQALEPSFLFWQTQGMKSKDSRGWSPQWQLRGWWWCSNIKTSQWFCINVEANSFFFTTAIRNGNLGVGSNDGILLARVATLHPYFEY